MGKSLMSCFLLTHGVCSAIVLPTFTARRASCRLKSGQESRDTNLFQFAESAGLCSLLAVDFHQALNLLLGHSHFQQVVVFDVLQLGGRVHLQQTVLTLETRRRTKPNLTLRMFVSLPSCANSCLLDLKPGLASFCQ